MKHTFTVFRSFLQFFATHIHSFSQFFARCLSFRSPSDLTIACAAQTLFFQQLRESFQFLSIWLVSMGWHSRIFNYFQVQVPHGRMWCSFWQVMSPSLESIGNIIQSIISSCYNHSCISYYMCDYWPCD